MLERRAVVPAGCAIGLGDSAAMKEAASGGVLAGAILVAHAKRVFLAFHENRGKPFARSYRVPAFASGLAAFAATLCAVPSRKAGVFFALAPTATTWVPRTPGLLMIQKLLRQSRSWGQQAA